MSKIDKLIQKLCPNEVKHVKLIEITVWDRKFNGIDNNFNKKFKHVSATSLKKYSSNNGTVKLISTGNFDGYANENECYGVVNEAEVITIPSGGTANIKYFKGKFIDSGNLLAISADTTLYNTKYIYYFLKNNNKTIQGYYRGSGIQHPDMQAILNIKIPIPPLEVQEEIVRMLDSFTELEAELEAELTKRKLQYEHYRDHLLSFENIAGEGGQVEWLTLGNIGEVCMCKRILKNQTQDSGIPFFKIGTFGKKEDAYITPELFEEYKRKYSYPKKGDILISAAGTIGRTVIFDGEPAYFQDSNIVWIDNDEEKVTNRYLYYFYQTKPWRVSSGGTIARIYNNDIKSVKIPVPTKNIQERIVYVLDNFDVVCNDLNIGLPAEIEARQKQYEYYRNKILTFKENTNAKTN